MATISKLSRRLRKKGLSPRIQYLLLTTGAAFLAERLARTAITQGWRVALREEPPRNPERLDVSWSSALGWTAVTGVAIALAGLAARRGATVSWKRYVGRRVPA
ncbi:MAG TPA: DUF4235 domain-containing protein [Thermoanaerobaculia bacterium]|nr:DUF4235 domain-containing protein [Thermoanaerobaculia bacterium]HXT51874.1 DUF4235 domain-containing protein [Thermoanaerobaculia bacterium]